LTLAALSHKLRNCEGCGSELHSYPHHPFEN
jgi:hypothetical protein